MPRCRVYLIFPATSGRHLSGRNARVQVYLLAVVSLAFAYSLYLIVAPAIANW